MKTALLLRIASIVAFIQYSGHSFLFFTAKPTHGPEEEALVEKMKILHWDFSGFNDSYWGFYFGYGLIAILWGVVEIILLWQLSNLAKNKARGIHSIIILLIAANIAHAVLALSYFFLLPAIFDILVAVLLVISLWPTQKNKV